MSDSDDDLTAALRRELAGTAVPHDDDRADAMIRAATATDPIGARSWQAPLAAAAAVLVIGGGATVIATTRGGSGHPSGDGPGGCPTASTSAVVDPSSSAALSSSGTRTTLPAPGTADQGSAASSSTPPFSSVVPNPSYTYVPPQPATSTTATSTPAPESTAASSPSDVPSSSVEPDPVPTVDSVSPCAPSSAPATSANASTSAAYPVPPLKTVTPPVYSASASPPQRFALIVIKAGPGEVRSKPVTLPFIGGDTSYGVTLVELSGRDGTVSAAQGSKQIFVHDLSELTAGPVQGRIAAFVPSGQDPVEFTLSCTGTTDCSVRVLVDLYTGSAPGTATATPSH